MASGQPSKFDRINAAEVLRLQKTGVNVPAPVRAAARRILQNQMQGGDSATVKNYRGIQKSGASKIRGDLAKVKGVVDPALHVEQSLEQFMDVVSRGGNPIAAGARLAQTVGNEVQTFLKQKVVKNVAEAVGKKLFGFQFNGKTYWEGAKKLGEDMLAIRRYAAKAAAIAGPVGFAAEMGWRLGSVFNQRTEAAIKRNSAAGESFTAARQGDINIASFGLQSRQISKDVSANQSVVNRVLELLGFDEDVTDERTKRIKLRAVNIQRARGLSREMGHNPGAALAKYASEHGKRVDQLTDRETALVIDSLNDRDINPALHANDDRVFTKLRLHSEAYGYWYMTLDRNRQKLERQKIFEEEVLPEKLRGEEIRREDRRRAAENQRDTFLDTPAKWQLFNRATEASNANWQAQLSRRSQVEYD